MAIDERWEAVDKVMAQMGKYRLYDSTLRAMPPVLRAIRTGHDFLDVYPQMTFYGLFLTRRRTGLFVMLGWSDDKGYEVSMGKASTEEYWDKVSTHDLDELTGVLREYLDRT